MANTPETTTTLSNEMATFYKTRVLETLKPHLVFGQFATKKAIPKGHGKTIQFRRFSKLAPATTALTEAVVPDGKNLTVTPITATIAEYGDYIKTSDLLEMTAIDPLITEELDLLSFQGKDTLDLLDRAELKTATCVRYSSKWSGGTETKVSALANLNLTATIRVNDIFDAARELKRKDVQPFADGSYVAIVHPDVATDLMKSSEWQDIHKYAKPESIYNGEVGKIGNVRIIETTNCSVAPQAITVSSATKYIAVYTTYVLGKDAFTETDLEGEGLEIIVKAKGSAGTADPLNQVSTVGWKAIKAVKLTQALAVCKLYSCATYQDAEAAASTDITWANDTLS